MKDDLSGLFLKLISNLLCTYTCTQTDSIALPLPADMTIADWTIGGCSLSYKYFN